jgi:hypothetical protein
MRTYTGLRTIKGKIERLLKEFRFSTLTSVYPIPAKSTPRPKAIASFA